ncbi:MAG: glycogen-binding domain-containing protein [Myxococcota bacterium]
MLAAVAWALVGSARAGSPLEAGVRPPSATVLGVDASAAAGADAWTGGGGPAVFGQLGLGGAWTRGRWLGSASAGSWVEAVAGSIFDGHAAAVRLRDQGGLGAALDGAGSASVGWGQVGARATADLQRRGLGAGASLGPVVRSGVGGGGVGGAASLWVAGGLERVRPAAEVVGTLWGTDALPAYAQGTVSVRTAPWLDLTVTPSASLLVTAPGPTTVVAGLPPGGAAVGRGGLDVAWRLGRLWTVSVDGAFEAGPATSAASASRGSAGASGGCAARCASVAAGAVPFRLVAREAHEVAVSGGFNGWTPVPLEQRGAVWTGTVVVPEGTWEYVYLVDGVAVVPPEAVRTRPDGFGGANGVLEASATPCR